MDTPTHPFRATAHPPARVLVACLMLCWVWAVLPVTLRGASSPQHGAVATVHPLATQAAEETFKQGGNAIDAAVVAALTLGVVDGHNSGIGGGCFLLIHTSDGSLLAIDGRETAPAKAQRDMFIRDGKADPKLSQSGPLAVGTPGALAAYALAVRRHGRLPLKTHLEMAARIAEQGFPLQKGYADRLRQEASEVASDPGCRALLVKSDGQTLAEGEWLKQPDLAATYRAIGTHGTGWFYGGEFARRVESWMGDHGGIVTRRDLSRYQVRLREPLRTRYRGYDIVGFPPPSSGGVHVGQILNILQALPATSDARDSAAFIHRVTEAMKLAFADRAYWLGDPDFTRVPRGLLDTNYAAGLAARISLDRASVVSGHGEPPEAASRWFGKHTTHFSTADGQGNWVACTATINTTLGAKRVVPGTGVFLNNEMDDFAAAPGVRNAFGLVGGDANAVAPGKRPLSSMSPTLVFKDGRPILSVGAAGGPTIISQTLLAILGVVDFGLSVHDALAAPRFHHQWSPDLLQIEASVSDEVVSKLTAMGHRVQRVPSLGACQAVGFDGSHFSASHDPRVQGQSRAW